ncbi:MAG: hypothetical protein AAB509_00270 [Patescibacteria group bacterium]
MLEFIVSIIFVVSFGGLLLILARKIPALVTMPQNGKTGIKKHRIILDVENKIKEILVYFEKQIYLHKLLSFIKIMILKAEVQVDHLLHKIRKKVQKIDKELKDKK